MRARRTDWITGILRWTPMALLLLMAAPFPGCADPDSDDDASSVDGGLEPGDDDATATGDDDATATGDDDATGSGDDDATATGDDDATGSGDDDATGSGDDDATGSGDDDATGSGDDDATGSGDDDATGSGDDDATGSGDDDATDPGDGPTPTPPPDGDGDGVPQSEDCNDADPSTYPGADEVCDGKDNDCNGEIDDDAIDAPQWYPDADGDGHGVDGATVNDCAQPENGSAVADDCDDSDPFTYPGAPEVCDGIDNNCNGQVDEAGASTFYQDTDGDGYGTSEATYIGCAAPAGYVGRAGDCAPNDPTINPGATEACNGLDDNCDGQIDEGTGPTWVIDADGDGAGDPSQTTRACEQPAGYVAQGGPVDCDDTDATTYPGASELCDGLDNDCDGLVDEGVVGTWYPDGDGDGYGSGTSVSQCTQPDGYAGRSGDCDDHNPAVHPGAAELCNGIDDDCDGVTDNPTAGDASTWYYDVDGDGYGDPLEAVTACNRPAGTVSDDTDCDDDAADTYPGAQETCDGTDQNCDGAIDDDAVDAPLWYADSDADGYGNPNGSISACQQPKGSVGNAGDCDDTNGAIHPGATEFCNGLDDNCNGTVDEGAVEAGTWYQDRDGDGYGDPSAPTRSCTQPSGTSANNQDCNDNAAGTHPGATETCDGTDQNCNGAVDDNAVDAKTWYRDADGDGYGNAASSIKACTAPAGYVASSTDCQDGFASIHPGAPELCDGIDNDCSGAIDDGASCPCEVLQHDSHAYMFCSSALDWPAASNLCENNGYSLTTINNDAENTWLVDRAYDRYAGKWWTGFTDQASEGNWRWISGQTASYTNWHDGEPNNSNGNENCMQLGRFGDYTWNDEPCSVAFRYICESD